MAQTESTARIIIQADTREIRSQVPELIRQQGVAAVEIAHLPVGDYQLAETVIAERKAASDFVLSIMDRRLFEQAARLKEAAGQGILVVEGDLFATRSKIHPNALIGALSWLALEGISILPSQDVRMTALLLTTLARHAQQGLGYEVALRASKPKEVTATQQFLVEGLPGIGAASAQDLLAHFGTPAKLFAASQEELCACPGVGPKTAQRIHHSLHTPWAGRQSNLPGKTGK